MFKYAIITLLLVGSNVYAKMPSLDKVQLRTGMNSYVVEAQDVRARVVGFNLGIAVEEKYNDYTDFFFDISSTLQSGSNESVGNVAEFAPRQGMNLHNVGLLISPFNPLSIQVGALDQGKYLSPLLLTSTSFAAIEEQLTFGSFYIRTQQAIPSNYQLTQRVGNVDDATPYFGMEMLGMKFGKKTFFRLEAGHFMFKDLSGATANKSKEFGNSVTGLNEAAEFNYAFEGINSMLQFQHEFNSGFTISLWGQYLYNDKAPDGRNKGQLANLGLGYKESMFYIESFRNESDSSPGFYNSKYHGHNNMQGASLAISFKTPHFNTDFKYTKAQVIEENFLQENMELLTFNLVKFYEI